MSSVLRTRCSSTASTPARTWCRAGPAIARGSRRRSRRCGPMAPRRSTMRSRRRCRCSTPGSTRKKALLVISDGNDTNSRTTLDTVRRSIRESDTLVYAIAIDAALTPNGSGGNGGQARLQQRGRPRPFPFPIPGRRDPPRTPPIPGVPPPSTPRPPLAPEPDEPRDLGAKALREPVNLDALRQITDDSGGFTELVRDPRDLNPTTGRIADELGKRSYLGYPSRGAHDGRWHAIRVEVRDSALLVRARRGYLGTAVVLARAADRDSMPHTHAHGHSHSHAHAAPDVSPRVMAAAVVATVAFVIVEAACGWWAGSLALLSDAGHNMTDAAALGLSWYALAISQAAVARGHDVRLSPRRRARGDDQLADAGGDRDRDRRGKPCCGCACRRPTSGGPMIVVAGAAISDQRRDRPRAAPRLETRHQRPQRLPAHGRRRDLGVRRHARRRRGGDRPARRSRIRSCRC